VLSSVLPRSTDVFNNSIFLGDYPVPEMPSGNTLMDMLDGVMLLYHSAAHKQLSKVCSFVSDRHWFRVRLSLVSCHLCKNGWALGLPVG